jgi:hypothetical protein
MMRKTPFVVLQEAIDVLLRHLEWLPPSIEEKGLRAGVRECIREAGQWSALQPTDRGPDALMKRVLALHVEVVKLERQGHFAKLTDVRCEPAILGGQETYAGRLVRSS